MRAGALAVKNVYADKELPREPRPAWA